MNDLMGDVVRRSCAFVIKMDLPIATLKSILDFLESRKIGLDALQLFPAGGGETMLILVCQVEKDRIKHVRQGLEKLPGVIAVDLLEGRG
jgi:hypothetical protein